MHHGRCGRQPPACSVVQQQLVRLLLVVALGTHCQHCRAKLLVDAPLGSLDVACPIIHGHQASHKNCSKVFLVSTTCVESWTVEREHLTQTIIPCPAGRPGMCTEFTVRWCNNSIYPKKGGCYRSEYAHTGLMDYAEYWFGFSLFLPHDYAVDVGSIHFQVHGNPNADVHEANRNPMFALKTDPKSGGNWQMLARGDPRRNISRINRTYEWEHVADLGPARLGDWEHFVYHTMYSHSSDGFIELWRNGKQLVRVTKTGTAYFDDLGPYFKFGIYSPSWGTDAAPPRPNASTNVVIYGGLKQGDQTSSYAEVDTSHPSARASRLYLKTTDGEPIRASARRVTVWWKPSNVTSLRADVDGMKRVLFATDVILYCGFAPLPNGSFGVVGSSGGGWGNVTLCRAALYEARRAGLSAQLVVEGRFDDPSIDAAVVRGGTAFGEDVLEATKALDLPTGPDGIRGLNFDWEPGKNRSALPPSETAVGQFTACLAQRLRVAGIAVTVDAQPYAGLPWRNLSRTLTVGGVDRVFAMGLYHGTSVSEWTSKLTNAIQSVGSTSTARSASTFAVGMQAGATKFAWENSITSVAERFAAMRRMGVHHIGVFAWARGCVSGGAQRPPAKMLAEWSSQLRAFVGATHD